MRYFDQEIERAYVMNTTEGPVVRLWVPRKGWYFIGQVKEGEVLKAGKPADPTPLLSVIKPL